MHHYPHHIGDYRTHTAHLTMIEDGAYRRMLDIYYMNEFPLPSDIPTVQRLAGARSKEERAAVETILHEFFCLEPDGWHNSRADKEIASYQERADKARLNGGRSGGRPRKTKPIDNPEETDPVISGFPPDNPDVTQTEPSEKLTGNREPGTGNRKPVRERDARTFALPIGKDWEPKPETVADLKRQRPDLVGDYYEAELTEFRLWCRANAVSSHDPEATFLKFMRKAKGPSREAAETWDQRRIREARAAVDAVKIP